MRVMFPLALMMSAIAAPARPSPSMPMMGGWSEAATTQADVRAAAQAALGHLPIRHAKLRRIEAASHQVVAGINYRLTLRLVKGGRWKVTVWRKLDGTFAVSDVARAQ